MAVQYLDELAYVKDAIRNGHVSPLVGLRTIRQISRRANTRQEPVSAELFPRPVSRMTRTRMFWLTRPLIAGGKAQQRGAAVASARSRGRAALPPLANSGGKSS